MGLEYTLECHHCGHTFRRAYGVGMLGRGTFYCDRCGKAHNVDLSTGWDPLPQCECGGTFGDEALGCCPRCGAPLTKEDIDPSSPICQWD